jgi:hypothetical protein
MYYPLSLIQIYGNLRLYFGRLFSVPYSLSHIKLINPGLTRLLSETVKSFTKTLGTPPFQKKAALRIFARRV